MPEACVSLWPTDACQWSVADIWHWSDLVQRSIYVGLALMLGYTFFVVIRFIRRYRSTCRELQSVEPDSGSNFHRNKRRSVADLSPGLEALKAIAAAAPLLGLAGTSYGILAIFQPTWGSRASALTSVVKALAHAPMTTVAGILVAIPAAFSCNLLRIRIEALSGVLPPAPSPNGNGLGSVHFAQTLSLKKHFSGLPPFALLAAPALACAVMAYMAFRLYPIPTGLPVRLLPIGSVDRGANSVRPVVVSVLAAGDGRLIIRVNSTEIPPDNLTEIVREKLHRQTEREAYVEGDTGAYWAYVAYVVDSIQNLHCRVILLTTQPAPEVGCGGPRYSKHSHCRQ